MRRARFIVFWNEKADLGYTTSRIYEFDTESDAKVFKDFVFVVKGVDVIIEKKHGGV